MQTLKAIQKLGHTSMDASGVGCKTVESLQSRCHIRVFIEEDKRNEKKKNYVIIMRPCNFTISCILYIFHGVADINKEDERKQVYKSCNCFLREDERCLCAQLYNGDNCIMVTVSLKDVFYSGKSCQKFRVTWHMWLNCFTHQRNISWRYFCSSTLINVILIIDEPL